MIRRKKYEPHERPPRFGQRNVTIESTIEPHQGRWRWQARFLFDGRPSLMGYSEGGTRRHPQPYTVQGFKVEHADARAELAKAVNRMREILVEELAEYHHREACRHVDVVSP